jgi:hypothetical protein
MQRFNGKPFERDINEVLNELLTYVSTIPDETIRERIGNEIKWAKDYIEIKQNKLSHQTIQTPDFKRGNIVIVKLGENIGVEFSGNHHAIVLRDVTKDIEQVFLLPITSKKPKSYNINNKKSLYIEIPKIPGLKGFIGDDPKHPDIGKHWANILNVKNISRKRILYPTKIFTVQGSILDLISNVIINQIAYRKSEIMSK